MINSHHNGIHETSEAEDIVGREPDGVFGGKKDLKIKMMIIAIIMIDLSNDDD